VHAVQTSGSKGSGKEVKQYVSKRISFAPYIDKREPRRAHASSQLCSHLQPHPSTSELRRRLQIRFNQCLNAHYRRMDCRLQRLRYIVAPDTPARKHLRRRASRWCAALLALSFTDVLMPARLHQELNSIEDEAEALLDALRPTRALPFCAGLPRHGGRRHRQVFPPPTFSVISSSNRASQSLPPAPFGAFNVDAVRVRTLLRLLRHTRARARARSHGARRDSCAAGFVLLPLRTAGRAGPLLCDRRGGRRPVHGSADAGQRHDRVNVQHEREWSKPLFANASRAMVPAARC
jgi:hypothetical protein